MKIARDWLTKETKSEQSPIERARAAATARRRTAEADAAIAAQRARMATLRPANDNVPRRFRGGIPVLNWIAKKDPAAAWSVREYGRVMDAMENVPIPEKEPPSDAPYGSGSDVDRVHGVRPSINEMLADLLRMRVVSLNGEIVQRVDGLASIPAFDACQARLAGMVFNYHDHAKRSPAGGLMTSYIGEGGRLRIPVYDTSKVRNGAEDDRTNWCTAVGGKMGVTRPISLPDSNDAARERDDILEMVLASMSLKAIGLALGFGEHYADRGAAKAVLQAAETAKEHYPPPTITERALAA